uniref:Uncharacterized protein n=1 Tax=Alexandrium monilatum TaxID=311494 RepID=A0A7S4PUT5_9DINO|mmetsp:Transcript_5574/g.17488  ORF Transcript_5574/g.17488 Transcript_5574/m.17488 type:complete len:648 (+) Transcript_5574:69-2012(+)
MIRYVRSGWFVRWKGGSCEKIWMQVLGYMAYCYLLFHLQDRGLATLIPNGSLKLLGGFATFSLVFTLNQCYARYMEAVHLTAQLFGALLNLNHLACSYAGAFSKGGIEALKPAEFRLTVATQVHVARLSIAIAVAFAVHRYIVESAVMGKTISDDCHVAILFNLTRLRGLLLNAEVPLVDADTGLLVQRDMSPKVRDHHRAWGCCRRACCCSPCKRCCSCQRGQRLDQLRVNFRYKSGRWSEDLAPLFHPNPGGAQNQNHFEPICSKSSTCSNPPGPGWHAWQTLGIPLIFPLVQLLRHHLAAAMNQPWGFPERFANIHEALLQSITHTCETLEDLVSMPLPMAYLQQRKLLFIAFAVFYPMTLPNQDGWWTNIMTPSIIFGAMAGFESVAEMLENPLGDDDADLNVDEMLHDLEVRVSKALRLAEERMGHVQGATEELIREMPLKEDASRESSTPGEHAEYLRRLAHDWGFDAHFVWRPVPPQVLVRSLEQMHGAHGQLADEEMRQAVLMQWKSDEDSDSDISVEGIDTPIYWHGGCRLRSNYEDYEDRFCKRGPHRATKCAKDLYRAVSLMRGRDSVEDKDLMGIDHFLCLRSRAGYVESLLEEFGREYVRAKRSKGAGGRLLRSLHERWRRAEQPGELWSKGPL